MKFLKILSCLTVFLTTVLSDCIVPIKTDIQFVISASNNDFNHCPENRICYTNQLITQMSPIVNNLGIIIFDKTADVVVPLNSHIDQLNQYVNNQIPITASLLTDKSGNGLLSTGLVQAMQQFKLYSQPDSQKMLVIVIDNYDSIDTDSIKFVINVLKSQFVISYGILIGNNNTKLPVLKQLMMTKIIDNWSDISDLNVSINKELEYMICNPFDYCNSQQCNSHGLCINQIGSYKCQCDIGYTGSNCQTYDFCSNQNICQNSGKCINTNNGFQCSCINGYYGSICQNRESCYVNPCQNGGTCFDQIDGFRCICTNSYTGSLCEQKKICDSPNIENAFQLSVCKGKMICNVQCLPNYIPTQSVIICVNGNWTRSNCEYNPCMTNTCNNHGICINNGSNYICQCDSCYTGLNCGLWNEVECKPIVNGSWSDWSDCSQSCNNVICNTNNTCTKYRLCNNPPPSIGGQFCIGDSEQQISCPIKTCPKLDTNVTWGNWVLISNNSNQLLCNSDIECTYHRNCSNGNCSNNQTDYMLTRICGRTHPCPIDCRWDQWYLINQITPTVSLKCGQYPLCLYKRSYFIQLYGGLPCNGSDTMISNCTNYIPVTCITEGVWTDWQLVEPECDCQLIPCNSVKTCTWYRNCTNSHCIGEYTKSINCTLTPCPVNGKWSDWGLCDCSNVLCGINVYCNKTRYCNNPPPSNGGQLCQSNNYTGIVETITEKCNNTKTCSISDCYWSQWSQWSICNASCEVQQIQSRTRYLLFNNQIEYTEFCLNQSSTIQFQYCPINNCSSCLCNSTCHQNNNQIKCNCERQLQSDQYMVSLDVSDSCESINILTDVGGNVKNTDIVVNSVVTNEKSKCCIRHNAFVLSENGCISKRNGELNQFKPCNYGTSICVIDHRSDFDQIEWTNNGYNCKNKHFASIQSQNTVTIIYQYISVNYTDINEHIHRLELIAHGILPDGANPFVLGSILQIKSTKSNESESIITVSNTTYKNMGLIIGLTLGIFGICVILFISILIFIVIITRKQKILQASVAYCSTPKHASEFTDVEQSI